jgi:hypothetical protein
MSAARRRRAAAGAASIAALIAWCSPVPAVAGSTSLTVIRDAEAGVDQLPHTVPGNALVECPQGQIPTSDCYDPDAAVEPSIATNPTNPLNVITTYQQGRISDGGNAGNGYSVTFDGGRTWTHGNFPGLTLAVGGQFERSSDPVVAFLPDGTAFATGDAVNVATAGSPTAIATWRSIDGGLHWGSPVLITVDDAHLIEPEPLAVEDKSWIAVDTGTGAGHHYGRIYVTWFRLGCQVCADLAAYSDDEGVTWQTGPAGTGYVVEPASEAITLPFVLPNGDLAVVAEDNLEAQLTSIDRIRIDVAPGAGSVATGGALVFSAQHQVALQRFTFPSQLTEADYSIAAAVDERTDTGAPNGRIFVVWADNSLRSDSTNDTFLSASSDGGTTWSSPVRVNPGPASDNVNHLAATPAVLADGTVLVAYRQRQENGASGCTGCSLQVNTMVQASQDHGATFDVPVKVNGITDDLGYAAVSHGGPFLGDYDQMAAAGDCAYVARAEPVQLSASEPEQMPPTVHHSRVYVAAIGDAGCALPATAVPDTVWVPALALVATAAASFHVARRRERRFHHARQHRR